MTKSPKSRRASQEQLLLARLRSLSLKEKASLCSGADFWNTRALQGMRSLPGVPPLRMADGPHGLRVEDARLRKNGGPGSRPATCFPPESALACSWSPELVTRVGEAIAQEALAQGVGLVLGPGANIKRSPLGGRNFEYYSEDPQLSGMLAAACIRGLQSAGAGACLKHYAVNSQEHYRMSISAAVDKRALFDLYLKPFEIAVKQGRPASVMASYNRVNGVWATENRALLTEILRLRFGFSGAVISDWGAVGDRVAALEAGMDLEMPGSGGVNDHAIQSAVERGALREEVLDTACLNLMRLARKWSRHRKARPAYDCEAHHRLAVEALEKSAVLLKNDGMLPLAGPGPSPEESIPLAVIGEMAEKPRIQGGGSSLVNARNPVSFLNALDAKGLAYRYAPGYRNTETHEGLVREAAALAAKADNVLLFLGLPDLYDCEGYDRDHLSLPQSQLRLIKAVAARNKNICVVLCCGGPVEMPWLDKVRAVLCLYLGGEGLGEAALSLLLGQANPSGKLAETWPLALVDTPSFSCFPMGPREVCYQESLYVGYRYYDKAQKDVLFPFGYGLSYTRFAYSDLRLSLAGAISPGGEAARALQPDQALQPGGALRLCFTLQNTGSVAGEEICQAYVERPASALFRPLRELKAWRRVALAPGETRRVELDIPYSALAVYDPVSGADVVEEGPCRVLAGPHSRDLPLAAELPVQGVRLAPPEIFSAAGPYGSIQDNRFPLAAFKALHGGPLEGNRPLRKGQYGPDTPLDQMRDSVTGRALLALARFVGRHAVKFSSDPQAARKAADTVSRELPFKNLVINTGGIISPPAAAALLRALNGEGGLARFVGRLFQKRPYRR